MSKVFYHKNLEINIGYKFRDRNLLLDAIKKNNKNDQSKNSFERLEFLGDRVLSLIVSDLLLERFPSANEGELSRRLVGLIRRETLATIAKDIVLVSISEKKNVNALADGLEALIGAIFCDGGIKHAKQFIVKFWSKIIVTQFEYFLICGLIKYSKQLCKFGWLNYALLSICCFYVLKLSCAMNYLDCAHGTISLFPLDSI